MSNEQQISGRVNAFVGAGIGPGEDEFVERSQEKAVVNYLTHQLIDNIIGAKATTPDWLVETTEESTT